MINIFCLKKTGGGREGAYNKGALKVIIKLSKDIVINFGHFPHKFFLLFCSLYGQMPITQMVRII